jgi:hypothetical protein
MRFKSFLPMLGITLVLAMMVGCAKAPQQEIDAANAALEAARTAEADRYLADQFNAAKDSLDAAMAEVEAQNSKFALTRNYDRALQLLQAAANAANGAKDAVATAKEQVHADAQDLMAQAQIAIGEAKALLVKAPKGKEGKEMLEQMQSELSAVETSLAEAQTELSSGNFISARDKAKAGLEKVNSIKDELSQAIGKKAALSKSN